MSCLSEDFDTELFIEEVKKYPELWNVGCEDYKNRGKRDAAWESIAACMACDYEEKSVADKKVVVKKCMTRWKNIKDTYSKSVKKRAASGKPARKHRVYLYARQLSFLQLSADADETLSTNEELDCDEPATNNTSEGINFKEEPPESPDPSASVSVEYTIPNKKNKRRRDLESPLSADMRETITVETPDDHESFFHSLLPIVRKFNEDQALEFRSEVLNVATRIKRKGSLPPVRPCTSTSSGSQFPMYGSFPEGARSSQYPPGAHYTQPFRGVPFEAASLAILCAFSFLCQHGPD